MTKLQDATSFMDHKNRRRFTTTEEIPQQLEQANHTTPNDNDENAERSTRAASNGLTPDTTEAATTKFLQDVCNKNHKQDR